jgi:hypothetical protein
MKVLVQYHAAVRCWLPVYRQTAVANTGARLAKAPSPFCIGIDAADHEHRHDHRDRYWPWQYSEHFHLIKQQMDCASKMTKILVIGSLTPRAECKPH